MDNVVISVENLCKRYEIGVIGATSLQRDVNRWWAKIHNRPDPYLKIGQEDLTDRAGEYLWALSNVNLKIKDGEAIGIIGRNGAGKSTLLKILSRVTAPTDGKVKIRGRIGSLLEVGTGFHPELTGRENIYLNGTILGMKRPEINNRLDEIIQFSGVEKYIDTPVKRYSSGMHVRLAFSVAAHLEPEILIVDEVLAVGDSDFQKKCLGKMDSLVNEGRTVIFVSHNLPTIQNLCSYAYLLDGGKIITSGVPKDVIAFYLNKPLFSQSGDIDLTDQKLAKRKNSTINSSFKWTRAQIFNSKGELSTNLLLNEPFELHLFGQLENDTDDLVLGFGVSTDQGIPLFSSHSIDAKIPKKYKKGLVSIKIRFDQNYLGPGQYTIDLGANAKNTTDWIPEAFKLNVEGLVTENGMISRANYDGIMVHPCEWTLIS